MPLHPKRTTIRRDSVFHRNTTPQITQGITDEETAPTRQTGVWLSEEEVEWLDNCRREIRRSGWRGVTRSAFLRSLVQASKAMSLDFSGVSGEAELTEALKRSLLK